MESKTNPGTVKNMTNNTEKIKKLLSQMSLEEKASLCSGSDFWHTEPIERLGIESVMMCDGPHGLRKQTGAADHLGVNASIETVCYPSASALACSFDRDLLGKLGTALGKECQAEDVSMLLGPGLNMKRSPLCGRSFEYFSEDPYLAGELAAAYIENLQKEGPAACVKHFACNNQETRRMSSSSNVSERALHEIYLPAFETAVKKGGTRSVMCGYNAVNGEYCAVNKNLLTDILRDQWGFDGFVVTDWGAVKDRVKGLEAGLDLEMPGGPGNQDDLIVKAVKEGRLDEKVLDETAARILDFVLDSMAKRNPEAEIDRTACSDLSRQLAENSAVLLKNEEDILPLRKEEDVVFIGDFAQNVRYQGTGSSHINTPHPVSAMEAVKEEIPFVLGYEADSLSSSPELIEEAVEAAKKANTAVIFAGLPDGLELEGDDRDHMHLPDSQNKLIAAVAAANPNTVVVLHGGAPVELPWIDDVKAVLCMYLGGEQAGAASVNLLYGKANPSGKLAETWPLKLADNPSFLNFPDDNGQVDYHEDIYIGYRYYDKKEMPVLFPFGYGLSYTDFDYDDLSLDQQSMTDQDVLTVTCKVKNTGDKPGSEIVQLYVRDEASSVRRPIRELKGFEKVYLKPGKEKTVTFRLDKRAFAYWEPKVHDWFVESGKFIIEIGASSRDIRLSDEIEVTGTTDLPITYTRESTVGDLLKSAAGRQLVQNLMAQNAERMKQASDGEANGMGAGSEKMIQNMVTDLPLGALVSYGSMSFEQLDGLIAMLNGSLAAR